MEYPLRRYPQKSEDGFALNGLPAEDIVGDSECFQQKGGQIGVKWAVRDSERGYNRSSNSVTKSSNSSDCGTQAGEVTAAKYNCHREGANLGVVVAGPFITNCQIVHVKQDQYHCEERTLCSIISLATTNSWTSDDQLLACQQQRYKESFLSNNVQNCSVNFAVDGYSMKVGRIS